MSGVSIELGWNDKPAMAAVETLVRLMSNTLPFYRAAGEALMFSVSERFRNEVGPVWVPWKPLAESTIASRIRRKRSAEGILRDRGYLRGSISYRAEEDRVTIGATAPYAAIHQLGGTITIPSRIQTLHFRNTKVGRRFARPSKRTTAQDVAMPERKVTITARPFLGFDREDEEEVLKTARDWIGIELEKGAGRWLR